MSNPRRVLVVLFVLAALALTALPVLAVEEPATTTDTPATDTTVAEDEATQNVNVDPPAVTVPPTTADDAPADWTYRYLIPTLVALAVIVVIATTVQYFLRVVRNRYKVVE